ncbi:MAG TPA: ABC transporter permease [Bacillota bacterium]|nr:ABC transporter permease [Bacillota bacterium]HNU94463.1 ABC transporter permease [Bacillota bacterium]HNY67587.1 ABC transporter permease [Bacillota bacterium]HOI36089.1 ABC transporter permease [Bacillota bacterium]HPU76082.1 ABC transporter permease [Bacillota bacterium]
MSQPRDRSVWMELRVPAAAVVIGLIIGAVFMAFTGANPLTAYGALLSGCFGKPVNISETLVYINPLIFTGLSIAVAYRAGLFNIGVEGQMIVGMLAAAVVGYAGTGLPRVIHLPLTILSGALAGALWAAVPGYLKARLGVHEVVNSIMMNYIALYLSHYLVNGPIKDPQVIAPYSREIADSAKLFRFFGGFRSEFRVNTGILIALAAAVLMYYILYKTATGYEIRAVGANADAARYAGINVPKAMAVSMLLAGSMAGLAGAVQVCGIQYKFLDLFAFEGFGLDGIAVALVGKINPFGVIGAASLFGILSRGAQMMQGIAHVPKQVAGIVQAAIVFMIAAEGLIEGWLSIPGLSLKKAGKAQKEDV